MSSTWRLGRALGVPIEFDLSVVLVAAIMAFALATSAFPTQFPYFEPLTYVGLGVCASILLYASVLIHELSHTFVAQRDGLVVEGVLLFAFGGVARLAEEPRNARQEFRMAAAGPACSLLVGAILVLTVVVLGPTWGHSPVLALLAYLAAINVALGLFNLVPGFPLDGGRMLRALLWHSTQDLRRATWASAALGQAVALLLVCWGVFRVYEGVTAFALADAVIAGLFLIFTGIFLAEAARRSYESVARREHIAVRLDDDGKHV